MKFPKEPRYLRTKKFANAFLLEYKFKKLPIDPMEIIKCNKWALMTYGELMRENSCSRKNIKKSLSEDGFTMFNGRNYTIAYDETIGSDGRKRFTLFHEIGHIYLGHLKEFKQSMIKRGSLKDDEYDVLEKEAHYFAKNVLAPLIVLDKLQTRSVLQICKVTGLSMEAAKNRYNDLINWKSRKRENVYDLLIFKLFYNFIYRKVCPQCGHGFISMNAVYCPICGHNKLKWGDREMIYNDGYELDENGRACICPRCKNEEIDEGSHCKICGSYIINKCINDGDGYDSCGRLADGNARFCVYCGCETTFYRDKLLKPWYELTEEDGNNEAVAAFEEDDDDLPF